MKQESPRDGGRKCNGDEIEKEIMTRHRVQEIFTECNNEHS